MMVEEALQNTLKRLCYFYTGMQAWHHIFDSETQHSLKIAERNGARG
jgi:hypothetical protein